MANYKISAEVESQSYTFKVEPQECIEYGEKLPGICITYKRINSMAYLPDSIKITDQDLENLIEAIKEVMRLRDREKLDKSIQMLNK